MFQKKAFVLAAMMATAAAAQAQVKLYGYMDLGVGSFKSAGNNQRAVTQVSSGNMMTSFLGFSGSEDLGGGMKAEFSLETFIAADSGGPLANNGGGFWGRASNVALSGGFGKVILGQYDTPLFVMGLTYNPFGSSMMFSPTMRHYYGLGQGLVGGAFARTLSTDTGWINSITYETPNMSGFMATLQWSPREAVKNPAPGVTNGDSATLGLSYNAGPLSVMLAYGTHARTSANAPAYAGKQKVVGVGASYDFGVLKAFAQYTDVNNNQVFQTYDDRLFQIGATVPVTNAGNVMVPYGELKRDLVAGTDPKNRIFSLGYDHALSKRTGIYGAYSSERHTGVKSGSVFAVGVRHSF